MPCTRSHRVLRGATTLSLMAFSITIHKKCHTVHYNTQHNCSLVLCVATEPSMLSIVMLSAVMLTVMAPFSDVKKDILFQLFAAFHYIAYF
jgi:hypothetical protein